MSETPETSQGFKKEATVGTIIAVLVLGSILLHSYLTTPKPAMQVGNETQAVTVQSERDYPGLSAYFATRINEISPTPPLGTVGWIIHRVSFVEDESAAYIEYTDTHIALRLLLRYNVSDGHANTEVLATYIPDEFGRWQLQYGQDIEPHSLSHYIHDGDSKQWIPEIVTSE